MKVIRQISGSALALALALPVLAQPVGPLALARRDAGDVAALNVLDGPGGKAHAPGSSFQFVEESTGGTAPKFVVVDERGSKWKVKLGPEARPETAASRLLWAAGYFADADYYREQITVQGMRPLARGSRYVSGGIVREARLEDPGDAKKLRDWSWYEPRVAGTREFNGLRVMMALINNWDLKTDNNSVYDQGGAGQRHVVSDLGASLGRTGSTLTRSKGVLKDYAQTGFIRKVTPQHVDFVLHSRPFFLLAIFNPRYYIQRTRMESIAKDIPVADARWLGQRLGQLSTDQIGDCFRAAGYSPAEVEGYTRVVLQRIEALKRL